MTAPGVVLVFNPGWQVGHVGHPELVRAAGVETAVDQIVGWCLMLVGAGGHGKPVGHGFGTFKHRMGYTHFLTRRLANVGTDMSLNFLAHNLRRVLSILGFRGTMKEVMMMGPESPFVAPNCKRKRRRSPFGRSVRHLGRCFQ